MGWKGAAAHVFSIGCLGPSFALCALQYIVTSSSWWGVGWGKRAIKEQDSYSKSQCCKQQINTFVTTV